MLDVLVSRWPDDWWPGHGVGVPQLHKSSTRHLLYRCLLPLPSHPRSQQLPLTSGVWFRYSLWEWNTYRLHVWPQFLRTRTRGPLTFTICAYACTSVCHGSVRIRVCVRLFAQQWPGDRPQAPTSQNERVYLSLVEHTNSTSAGRSANSIAENANIRATQAWPYKHTSLVVTIRGK